MGGISGRVDSFALFHLNLPLLFSISVRPSSSIRAIRFSKLSLLFPFFILYKQKDLEKVSDL